MGYELPRIGNLCFNRGVPFNFALNCLDSEEAPIFVYNNKSPRCVRIVIAEDAFASFSWSTHYSSRVNVIFSMLGSIR